MPTRTGGQRRVEALLTAAAFLIAERGFQGTTMAEVAARAGAQIGSLYRFFPNKLALGAALILRYIALVEAEYEAVDCRLRGMPLDELADFFLDVMARMRGETRALGALLDAGLEWSGTGPDVGAWAIRRIATTLLIREPGLDLQLAADMAALLLHNMKLMSEITPEEPVNGTSGTARELRLMNRLYLASKLPGPDQPPKT